MIAFNLIRARNLVPALVRGAADTISARVLKRWVFYFRSYGGNRWKFYDLFRSVYLLNVSFNPIYTEFRDFESSSSVVPYLSDHYNSFAPLEAISPSESICPSVIAIFLLQLTSASYQYVSSIYRLLVVLLFFKIWKF